MYDQASQDSTFQLFQELQNGMGKNTAENGMVPGGYVKNEIDRITPEPPLKRILDTLFRSKYFKNLESYRNCSTHRRQIYLKTTTVLVSETPGYNSTVKLPEVRRILCDNPLIIKPIVKQNREIIKYTSELYNKVEKEILIILQNI